MIQLYGQYDSYFSFAKVSRDYAKAISLLNLPFQIFHTGQVVHHKENYIDCDFPQGLDQDSLIGMAVGYPDTIGTILKNHKIKILVTVCESDRIPANWVAICNTMDLIIVPSDYCLSAFRYSGVTAPMVKIKHGLEYASSGISFDNLNPIRLLHVSNAVSFPARKGTSALLRAYRALKKNYPLSLTLVMPGTGGLEKVLQELDITDVLIYQNPIGYKPTEMIQLYGTHHFVVQPSRAEGFGLIPLEAKQNGCIAIYTNNTGHREHFDYTTDVEIKTGPLSPIDTQGNSIGVAPIVSWQSVADAIQYGINNAKELAAKRRLYTSPQTSGIQQIINCLELKKLLRDNLRFYKPALSEL